MQNDIVRFANAVEYTTGKKRGRKPVFSAAKFYPYRQERELQSNTSEEFQRFINEALEKATIGLVFVDDIGELSDLDPVLPDEFMSKVNNSAYAISRKAMENFAEQSEMIIGKPYYPPSVKEDILSSWEANFKMLCKSAETDAKKDIAQIVLKAKNEGWNKRQLEKAVKEQLPDKYKSRAELIARTETAKLNTQINIETYKEIGISYYTWMSTLDDRCRESHAIMNDKICSISDPDVYYEETEDGLVEHQRTGDMVHLHPGEDYQCRCSMVMWDQMLQGKYQVKERPEEEPEEKPKTTAEILKETEEQLALAREQLEGANRKAEILQAAAIRHAARTAAQRNGIIKRLNTRLEVRKFTHEVVNEAEGINGIGLEELKEAMKGGSRKQYVKMNNLAKKVRERVNELKSLKYVQNPVEAAKEFNYNAVLSIEKSVDEKLKKWNFNELPLSQQRKKLLFEIEWVENNKKYSSWKVARDAYAKLLKDVELKIDWEKQDLDFDVFKSQVAKHPKSKWLNEKVKELEELAGEKNSANLVKSKETLEKANAYLSRIDKEKPKKSPVVENLEPHEVDVLPNATVKKMIAEFNKVHDDSADDLLRPVSMSLWKDLSHDEKWALTKYTETYSYLNEPLRKISYQGARKSSEYINDLPIMTSAIEKSIIPNNIVVSRGTSDFMTSSGVYLSSLKKGDQFIDGAFMSTAVKNGFEFSKPYTLKIAVPKGAKGVYAEPFSHYNDTYRYKFENDKLWNGAEKESFSGERELILQRGSKLEVVEVHGKTIYCKLIGQMFNQP